MPAANYTTTENPCGETLHMRRLLTVVFCLMGGIYLASAQEVSFYLNQDTLSLDDELEVNVWLSGNQQVNPKFPEIEGFEKKELRTRRERTESGIETVFSQHYRPLELGSYQLAPFEVKAGKDAYLFPGRELVVLESELFRENYLEESVDAFLDFRINKTECYVGEQVMAEALFYIAKEDVAKIRLDPEEFNAFGQRVNNPEFWEERLEHPERFSRERRVGNKTYVAHQMYKGFLFALKPGEYPFSEVFVAAEKRMVSKWATDYDVQVNKRIRFKPIRYRSAPRSIKVLPLPDPAITRSVGNFRLETSLAPLKTLAGERVELRINVSGDGNIPLLATPVVPSVAGIQRFETQSQYTVDKEDSLMSGNKEFVFGMMPGYAGEYEIGPVVFTYFDPRREVYDSLISDPMVLTVTGEDRPQVLEANRLDGFYRLAFSNAGPRNGLHLPAESFWTIVLGIGAICMLIAGLWLERSMHQNPRQMTRKEEKLWDELKNS